ncbi:MAG TPA: hypothetical protein VK112_11100, partial [Fodinibius sp.]|nr:hypothetical protein [Fodinibius sp.]
PGLALLRLAQDRVEDAEAAISRVEKEKEGEITRSNILPAYIEIMLSSKKMAKADFLTDEQKRDILYNNAVRFLQMDSESKGQQ